MPHSAASALNPSSMFSSVVTVLRLHTKQPVLSFVLVRLLDLRDVLLGALFLWRNNSSLSNLFLVCLHHIYPLCALW